MKSDKNKFLLDAFVHIPNYVFIKDKNLIYQACNQGFAQFSGLESHKEIEGLTDFEMPWNKKNAELYRKEDLEIIQSGKSFELKEVPMEIQGEKKILLVSKAALFDENQQVIGILGVYIDITQQKDLEQQLKIARNRAEVASHSKSEFIANMSHDIRTPVTGILAMSQHMINSVHKFKASLTPKNVLTTLHQLMCIVDNNAELLIKATNELLTLCNNILEVVQLESGKQKKPKEVFDLRALMKHTINLLQPVAHNKGLSLTADIDKSIPDLLQGERLYLDRILLNLVSNALKFTDQGFVQIKIKNDPNSPPQNKTSKINIIIEIRDSGIGIPADKQEYIFDHFSRLTESHEGIYKGTGLGLYTVKNTLEQMGGNITVESTVGKGSTFIIQLTFDLPDPKEKMAHEPSPRRKQAPIASVQKLLSDHKDSENNLIIKGHKQTKQSEPINVLIVEDSQLAALGLTTQLEQFICTYEIVNNGKEAIQRAQETNFTIILLDMGLPDINGIEVTKEIRSNRDPKKANIPIIAVTGHGDSSKHRKACHDVGINKVLVKPTRIEDLHHLFSTYAPEAIIKTNH